MISKKKSLDNILLNLFHFFVLALVLCLTTTTGVAQQDSGQVSGTVKDANDAVIPNASVVARNAATNFERTTTTDEGGTYTFTNLQPGAYEISATAQGFQPAKDSIQVTVGSRLTLNLTAGVSNVAITVDVASGTDTGLAEINTTDQQVSNVVTSKQILDLPTLDRNPYRLVELSGNVSTADPSGQAGRGVGVAINGQRSASTNVLLDGVENADTFTTGFAIQPPLDSVSEFRVVTSNFTAELGRATGGVVNVRTKSGTNRISGTAYAFNRNSAFAANTFDNNAKGAERPLFNRNQFGYSVGGPIVKDKAFFFNSTEWTLVRSTAAQFAWVPTQAFLNTTNAATRNFFSRYGSNLAATRTGVFSTVADTPGLPAGSFERVQYNAAADAGGGVPQNTYSTVTRLDWNVSDKTQISGRHAASRLGLLPGSAGFSPYEGFDIATRTLNNSVQGSVTHQFTDNLVSNTLFGFRQTKNSNALGSDPNVPTLYALANTAATIQGDFIAFPGFLPFNPGSGLPISGAENQLQFNQDTTYLRGDHNFRFGGQFFYIQDRRTFPAFQNAALTLGGNLPQAFANLQNGLLRQIQTAVDPQGQFPGGLVNLPVTAPNFTRTNRYKEFSLYAQDSWRIIPNVTLVLGVRYDNFGPQESAEGLDSNFYFGSGSTIQEQIRNGQVRDAREAGGLWQRDNNNFAPRVGFAWDVRGNGRTSLRGGYSVSYERNFGNVTFNVIQNPPFYGVISLLNTDVGGVLPIPTDNFGPLAGTGASRPLPRVSLRQVRPDIVTAYAHIWSASFEQRVLGDSVVRVEYSGSAGRNLYSLENINRLGSGTRFLGSNNAAVCPPGLTPDTRLNCQYSNINTRGNGGYSNYQGVVTSFESNNLFNLGLTLTSRYTYSHTKDNLSSTFSESNNNFNLGLTDPFDPSYDYGYSDFDVRHRYVGSFIWDLPFDRSFSNGFAKRVLGGWSLNGIVTAQSGAPYTIFDCTNALTTCVRLSNENASRLIVGRPDALESNGANSFVYQDLSGLTPSTFTDVSGFTEVGPFPTDVVRRNSFRRPGGWNFDAGVIKDISIDERRAIQLRAELINAFNMTNLFVVGSSADLTNGQVLAFRDGSGSTSIGGQRTIQFSAKFLF